MENPDKGALWPYIRNVDFYRCLSGRAGHVSTYAIVAGADGSPMPGMWTHRAPDMTFVGKRVGRTVVRLTSLTDIVSPATAQRMIFVDTGETYTCYKIEYLYPWWLTHGQPPINYSDGATLSFADGYTEYWKWKAAETVGPNGTLMHREPRTEDCLSDLQRLQKVVWGRLGYGEESP